MSDGFRISAGYLSVSRVLRAAWRIQEQRRLGGRSVPANKQTFTYSCAMDGKSALALRKRIRS